MIIRDMTKTDAHAVAKLFLAIDRERLEADFGDANTLAARISLTGEDGILGNRFVRVAEAEGRVCGICVTYDRVPRTPPTQDEAMTETKEDVAFALAHHCSLVDALSVDERHRRQGIGHALIEDAKRRHDEVMLMVDDENEPAMRLYESCGFRTTGMLFGGDPEDPDKLAVIRVMQCSRTDESGKPTNTEA